MSFDWLKFENEAKALGYANIAGIDEAGRGPLAGPVVAAAVILQGPVDIQGVNDSKKISEAKRYSIYEEALNHPHVLYGLGIIEPDVIDSINILQATFLAMRTAVQNLPVVPDFLLVDGNQSPRLDIPTKTIVKGDSLSFSIALASIFAKVTRDRIMDELHQKMPQYEFNQHKGYPTAKHKMLIQQFGTSPFHRKSFNSSF